MLMLVGVSASGRTAVAQPQAPQTGQTEADAERRARALELFQASKKSYRAGRFGEAAVYLEEAYRLDANPILLYNLARTRESEGDLERALSAYRHYVREAPEAEDRAAVEARISGLERQISERNRLEQLVAKERMAREAAAARAEAMAEAARGRQDDFGPWPWVIGGLGVAGVATGVVLGVVAEDRRSAADREMQQRRASELGDEADGLALGANIAYAAGGALALGGLVWGLVAVISGDDSPTPEAAVWVGPHGLTVIGRF